MSRSRSVSQYNEWKSCPYAYYLKRVARVWQRPAAWLPHGTAVHEAAEAYERSSRTMGLEQAHDVFRESYSREVSKYTSETPNLSCWDSSGPYRAGEEYYGRNGKHYPSDLERRYNIGLEHVAAYLEYYSQKAPREVVWVSPEGEPGIELSFEIDLGGVPVRGYIDTVIDHPEHGPIVRDLKTGAKPGDDFQLAVYAEAVRQTHGADVTIGDYWMARQGKPTVEPYKLDLWDTEALTEAFHELETGVQSGSFEPKPEPEKCRVCSVNASCPFFTA